MDDISKGGIELFSTCPPLGKSDGRSYLRRVIEVARWSEEAGCRGILIYTDNGQLDPWLVAQVVLDQTERLCPLVAVQPIYMHPHSIAKMVSSLGYLYGRRLYLNMVAGGFKNDLAALNDHAAHDQRYGRLIEYTRIIQALLAGDGPVSLDGSYYKVDKLKLAPPLRAELRPGIFISGSSPAGRAAAEALHATAINYPEPLHESAALPVPGVANGVRIGILSRPDESAAWAAARARFPEDRTGQLTRQLATRVSDSLWHKQLSDLEAGVGREPYWLVPFQQYQTNCPYLVGDYARVGKELAGYIAIGYRTFILDVPANVEELSHIRKAFEHAALEMA